MSKITMKKHIALVMTLLLVQTTLAAELDAKNRAVLNAFMKQENIVKVTAVKDSNWGKFIKEYLKIPKQIRKYMLEGGSKIHIMEGEGVTVDPSWSPINHNTHDNRDWDQVPGSGGQPFYGQPTRIVVNKMSHGHGSSNLVLHEYAHALDSNESTERFSRSPYWQNAFKSQSSQTFLKKVCGEYCTTSPSEAFAEAFSYFADSKEKRDLLQKEAPNMHSYMVELTHSYVIHRNSNF